MTKIFLVCSGLASSKVYRKKEKKNAWWDDTFCSRTSTAAGISSLVCEFKCTVFIALYYKKKNCLSSSASSKTINVLVQGKLTTVTSL